MFISIHQYLMVVGEVIFTQATIGMVCHLSVVSHELLYQSLLEYKAMNVERQRHIFVEPWSNSIHIALWRNDGFLHIHSTIFQKVMHLTKILQDRSLFSIKFSLTFQQQNLVVVLQFTFKNDSSRF